MKKGNITSQMIDDKLLKETALSYVGVVFLIMIAVVFIWPHFSDMARIKDESQRAQKQVRDLEKSLSTLDKMEELISLENQDLLFKAVPENFEPGVILENLRVMSRQTGVVINDYSLSGGVLASEKNDSGVRKADGLSSSKVILKVAGATPGLIQFIKSIEKSVPVANVQDVVVSEVSKFMDETINDEVLNMSMVINYYYFPAQPPLLAEVMTDEISADNLEIMKKLAVYQKPIFQSSGTTGMSIGGGNENLFGE